MLEKMERQKKNDITKESEEGGKEEKEGKKTEELKQLKKELFELRKLKREKESDKKGEIEEKEKGKVKKNKKLKYKRKDLFKEEETVPVSKLIIQEYPWLKKERYEFMYHIPDKKKNESDYDSWRSEWGKVLFYYAKNKGLHLIDLLQLCTKKPFSNLGKPKKALGLIGKKLIEQNLAAWWSEKEDVIRIYWKSLDFWGKEIYHWAYELGKLDPILIFELRDANKQFSTLPKDDIITIFEKLEDKGKGDIIKTGKDNIAFKIDLE